jgi:hypothetical protein
LRVNLLTLVKRRRGVAHQALEPDRVAGAAVHVVARELL